MIHKDLCVVISYSKLTKIQIIFVSLLINNKLGNEHLLISIYIIKYNNTYNNKYSLSVKSVGIFVDGQDTFSGCIEFK